MVAKINLIQLIPIYRVPADNNSFPKVLNIHLIMPKMLDCPSPSTKQPIIYFIVAEVETIKIGQDGQEACAQGSIAWWQIYLYFNISKRFMELLSLGTLHDKMLSKMLCAPSEPQPHYLFLLNQPFGRRNALCLVIPLLPLPILKLELFILLILPVVILS